VWNSGYPECNEGQKSESEPKYIQYCVANFIICDTINHMIIVGITGASGALLGIRCIEELVYHNKQIAVIVSKSAWPIIHHEMQTDCTSIISIVKQRTMQQELLCKL
jgi:hypothetical protein